MCQFVLVANLSVFQNHWHWKDLHVLKDSQLAKNTDEGKADRTWQLQITDCWMLFACSGSCQAWETCRQMSSSKSWISGLTCGAGHSTVPRLQKHAAQMENCIITSTFLFQVVQPKVNRASFKLCKKTAVKQQPCDLPPTQNMLYFLRKRV